MSEIKILILEDEVKLRKAIALNLEYNGFSVHEAESGIEALKIMGDHDIEFLLCDLRLPGELDGFEVLAKTKRAYPHIPVIIMTAFGGVEEAVKAMKLGANDYLSKPFEFDELLLKIKKTGEQMKIIRENVKLRKLIKEQHSFDNIIGQSKKMQEVFDKIRLIAPHDTSVLITGSSGTGKELVAKSIHFNSPRYDNNFHAINCAALPKDLMESELFGHVKGAFTGATRTHKGLFLEASKGSLFLDEVGELPLDVQAKFLRVLEEQKVRPIGSSDLYDVDVRIITATSKNLEAEASSGNFREDLFYRLNVVQINLPDLSERIEDIPLLIDHFTKMFGEKLGRQVILSEGIKRQLMTKKWKGNVREFANFIERLILLSKEDFIESMEFFDTNGPLESIKISIPEKLTSLKEVKNEIEKITEVEMIKKAIALTEGNHTKAAKILGISHRSLLYKLKEHKEMLN